MSPPAKPKADNASGKKPATARPRQPANAGPQSFARLLEPYPKAVRDVAAHLRCLVYEVAPSAHEGIYLCRKVGIALYAAAEGANVFCGIQPSATRCLLYVHNVGQADCDVLPMEGKGRHAQHVQFGAVNEIRTEAVRNLLWIAVKRTG